MLPVLSWCLMPGASSTNAVNLNHCASLTIPSFCAQSPGRQHICTTLPELPTCECLCCMAQQVSWMCS
jgi:hypothetical protein